MCNFFFFHFSTNWSPWLQVSEYIGQLNEKYSEDKKHLKLEMSNLQQVSDNGKEEAVAYAGMVESQLQEDNSLHAKLRDKMEDILQQWYPSHLWTSKHLPWNGTSTMIYLCLRNIVDCSLKKGDHSVSYLSHTQSAFNHLCKSSIMEADDFVQ